MRKLFILTHRWAAIVGSLLFIGWFISGIVFTFWNMPGFSGRERLSHLAPFDLSTAQLEPMEIARELDIEPTRLRIGMYYDGRPVYRFQGATVYADTGEPVAGRNANEALQFVRQLEPGHAATIRYDELREDIDLWTSGSRGQVPLHKIALNDSGGTYYYISQRSGEVTMKTDRASRFWGFWGPVLHQWYFTPLRRNTDLWDQLVLWGSLLGNLVCLSGLVAGIWQFSFRGRYRKKGEPAYSPYSGWLWWHHYAGLMFGVISFTWIFSGGLAYSYYQGPSIDPTNEQRAIATGGPINLEPVTLDGLRKGLAAISQSFRPKEADVLQFRGELYMFAADGPSERPLIGATERDPSYKYPDYRMVWLKNPERGTFTRFDDETMMKIARESMPGIPILKAEWIHEYDNYYRSRQGSQPLPVLRVRYDDATHTSMWLDPHRGTIALRQQDHNRHRRWLYNGLHKFDFPYIYYPSHTVWATSIVVMSIGCLVLSMTTLVPSVHRLRRHVSRAAQRVTSKIARRRAVPVVLESKGD